MLSAHFNPLLSEISSCTAECGSRESVATSVSELRSLAEHCTFESTLEDMLRDRIVCSINDHAIQQRLLSEEKLTFEKAMSAAQAMETAARNAKELRNTPVSQEIRSGPWPIPTRTDRIRPWINFTAGFDSLLRKPVFGASILLRKFTSCQDDVCFPNTSRTFYITLATHGNRLPDDLQLPSLRKVSSRNGCMCKPQASNAEQSEVCHQG